MKDLIEALKILSKYTDAKYPTGCEHDVFYVYVEPGDVSDEDNERLVELGFFPDVEIGTYFSFRFG